MSLRRDVGEADLVLPESGEVVGLIRPDLRDPAAPQLHAGEPGVLDAATVRRIDSSAAPRGQGPDAPRRARAWSGEELRVRDEVVGPVASRERQATLPYGRSHLVACGRVRVADRSQAVAGLEADDEQVTRAVAQRQHGGRLAGRVGAGVRVEDAALRADGEVADDSVVPGAEPVGRAVPATEQQPARVLADRGRPREAHDPRVDGDALSQSLGRECRRCEGGADKQRDKSN